MRGSTQKLNGFDFKLGELLERPIVIDYENTFDWVGDIRKVREKELFRWESLINIGNITLREMGYDDDWARRRKVPKTNLTFTITFEQMKELRDLLNHKINQESLKRKYANQVEGEQ